MIHSKALNIFIKQQPELYRRVCAHVFDWLRFAFLKEDSKEDAELKVKYLFGSKPCSVSRASMR